MFKPLNDYIVFRPFSDDEMRELESSSKLKNSGIILTHKDNDNRGKTMFGKVVAVGPGKLENNILTPIPSILQDGIIIFCSEYDTNEMVINGEEYRSIRASFVFGIYEK